LFAACAFAAAVAPAALGDAPGPGDNDTYCRSLVEQRPGDHQAEQKNREPHQGGGGVVDPGSTHGPGTLAVTSDKTKPPPGGLVVLVGARAPRIRDVARTTSY
jgi:hypothetical protein